MKKWYQSKTYWFNITLGVIGVIELNSKFLETQLSPTLYGYGMMAVAVLGIMLRNLTTEKIQ